MPNSANIENSACHPTDPEPPKYLSTAVQKFPLRLGAIPALLK